MDAETLFKLLDEYITTAFEAFLQMQHGLPYMEEQARHNKAMVDLHNALTHVMFYPVGQVKEYGE